MSFNWLLCQSWPPIAKITFHLIPLPPKNLKSGIIFDFDIFCFFRQFNYIAFSSSTLRPKNSPNPTCRPIEMILGHYNLAKKTGPHSPSRGRGVIPLLAHGLYPICSLFYFINFYVCLCFKIKGRFLEERDNVVVFWGVECSLIQICFKLWPVYQT